MSFRPRTRNDGSGTPFAPGDRVVALANTHWDDGLHEFTEAELAYTKLHGHYGHVVADCSGSPRCHNQFIHVRWEGTYDGRSPGPTHWTDGYTWHMDDAEIEHAD
jgi:hypothetical protein